jgi:hypothetical protein
VYCFTRFARQGQIISRNISEKYTTLGKATRILIPIQLKSPLLTRLIRRPPPPPQENIHCQTEQSSKNDTVERLFSTGLLTTIFPFARLNQKSFSSSVTLLMRNISSMSLDHMGKSRYGYKMNFNTRKAIFVYRSRMQSHKFTFRLTFGHHPFATSQSLQLLVISSTETTRIQLSCLVFVVYTVAIAERTWQRRSYRC